ncbi:MAG: acetyl-CoA carboxylase biotin carboxyl carrier protein [Geminicoccaceae bacterium]|nr:acetyl-CoA carboxylase biotin carboxyl carrier protein [Geminicoccaceae bacterium]MCX8101822.1 acetyl-CoA carboxylase biotin carboxyl carrier protein [Geminicoccaceae bacterium]MDW8370714.1 acetyl-CoA carboxylase biotin carboxyl carrier protein [Geminicoccaceae bacterium]
MASIDIDIGYVEKLAELLQRTGLTEIEIGQGDARIRVARQIQQTVEVQTVTAAAPSAAASANAPLALEPAPSELNHPGLLTSPMVGTAYLAPEPGAAPFVTVGQEVREGATVLIIEAMKVMNSIRAPRSGRITRIFVENAQPVEFGEPLMIIE